MKQSCKTCKHWDISIVTDHQGIVTPDCAAPCRWPVPTYMPNWYYEMLEETPLYIPWTKPDFGDDCDTYEAKK